MFGGVSYNREHLKEVNYKEDICLVLTFGYRNHICQTRSSKFNCYSTAWDVQLSTKPSINATAESDKKYPSIDEALRRTIEHQVNTNVNDRVRSLLLLFLHPLT